MDAWSSAVEPRSPSPPAGPADPPGLARRVAALAVGGLLIWACAFRLLPALKHLSAVGPKVDLLEQSGIEAGAFWYTDVEKVGIAERTIASLDLAHEKPGRSRAPARDTPPARPRSVTR